MHWAWGQFRLFLDRKRVRMIVRQMALGIVMMPVDASSRSDGKLVAGGRAAKPPEHDRVDSPFIPKA